MEIRILKQHCVFRTLCKTNKIGYFSLSFDYSKFCGKNVYSIYYYYRYYYFVIIIIFFCRNLFLRIAGKIANIRTRKNVVPHGSLIMLLPDLTVKRNII